MKVLRDYIIRHGEPELLPAELPESGLNNIVVIPALGEPALNKTIESLWHCHQPHKPVEIIVVLNSSETSSGEIIEQNHQNEAFLTDWAKKHNQNNLKLFWLHKKIIPKKIAGAGLSRKLGMDWAIGRLIQAGKQNGILTSLDADALVERNYLIEIEKLFEWDIQCSGCAVHFEHPISGDEFSNKIYHTIIDYELHLRYFKHMMQYIGFPYYHYTVGSSFAVSAKAYCKQGGMNKKQAGEDFYFLHKIMPLGRFYELNTTTVFPSSRPSNRVPFGTGATISQYSSTNFNRYKTYNFDAFEPLKQMFADIGLFYKAGLERINTLVSNYNYLFLQFLHQAGFINALVQMNSNSADIRNFNKRFFTWFDAFRIIKYLNYVHTGHIEKQDVKSEVMKLFQASGLTYDTQANELSLLDELRNHEKEHVYFAQRKK
jgi:hypothetical protein